jgi:hypothetical protein
MARYINWDFEYSTPEAAAGPEKDESWVDALAESDPLEASLTVRLSKRQREQLDEIKAVLGTATLNRAVRLMIRVVHRKMDSNDRVCPL